MVKFSKANAKIEALKQVESLQKYLEGKKVYSFDLLSGFSCPFAKECLSKLRKIAKVSEPSKTGQIQSLGVFLLVKRFNILTYTIYAKTI